jgi:uncharacterized protein DUF1360
MAASVADSAAGGSSEGGSGVTDRVAAQADAYQAGHDQPLLGYATSMAIFTAGCVAAAVAVRRSGHELPDRYRFSDLLLGGMAVHKLSRIITKEAVTSPLRMPFTRFTGDAASAELTETVRGSGLRRSAGELLTCPFCLAPWLSSGYVAALVTAPRAARAFAAVFSVVFASDSLQHLYARLTDD